MEPSLFGVAAAQVRQSFAPPPEQAAQLELHARQRKLESSYMPFGHVLMHADECRMGELELGSHEVQLLALPVHVRQVEAHAAHVTPSEARCWPRGHTKVHVPATELKVAPARQDVQNAAPPPLPSPHVAHVASQGWHVLSEERAYLPLGQDATQAPASKYLVSIAGHVRHEVLLEPRQVRQLEGHAVHEAPVALSSTKTPEAGHWATQLPL